MAKHDLFDVDPHSLVDLMDPGVDDVTLWRKEELGAILEHQLAAPIQFDMTRMDRRAGEQVDSLTSVGGAAIRSFRELFEHPHPPVEMLQMTKRFAKACRSHRTGPVPRPIATILYVASIAAALVRCGRRITKLDEGPLGEAFDWALAQPWLDASTRDLLRQGREALERPNQSC
jgi:hypothetical protein